MRIRLNLETLKDVHEFVEITSEIPEKIIVKDNVGHCVDAKSILGMLYSLEWAEIWCESETDIYSKIQKFTKD